MIKIGIDEETMQMTLPRGAPYCPWLQLLDNLGEPQALAGRDLALSLYRGATVLTSVIGVVGTAEIGPYAAFPLTGSVSASLTGPCSWEIAELAIEGKVPLLGGAVYIAAASPSAAGDGDYSSSDAGQTITWSPSRQIVIVTERGSRGFAAEGIDPGDLTLIFDNHLI